MNSLKIRVKFGPNEFEAEGPEETVKAQFAIFLKVISATSRSEFVDAAIEEIETTEGLPSELSPFFRLHRGGIISLKKTPNTDNRLNDSLILLIYAYQRSGLLQRPKETGGFIPDLGEPMVPSGKLMAAATKSGLELDRIDRVIAGYGELFYRHGAKKGTKYGLTVKGKSYAKDLLNDFAE